MRAVIFDLWDTLVDHDVEAARAAQDLVAERLGLESERFAEAWRAARPERETGSLADCFRRFGATEEIVGELVEMRLQSTRRALVPRRGAVETLDELGRRGIRRGLISVCSEEVVAVWPTTPFAGRFEAEVFSCSVGLVKPDPRIYLLACERLDVSPEDCLFVGDGANDELAGATRAGLEAALILRPHQSEPYWEEARGFEPRITSIPEVLNLC